MGPDGGAGKPSDVRGGSAGDQNGGSSLNPPPPELTGGAEPHGSSAGAPPRLPPPPPPPNPPPPSPLERAALFTLAVAYRSEGPTSSTSSSTTVRFSPSLVSYDR